MIALERFKKGAERMVRQKPQWLNWLPEDPSQITMVYMPPSPEDSENPGTIILTKPAAIPGEIETTDSREISKEEIDSAHNWLDFGYSKIHQNEDEKHDLKLAEVQGFVATVDDVRRKVVPVLAFARANFKPQPIQPSQSQ